MHAKIALLVIALGACACTLLAMRQSRLQVASELTQTQLRINAADERLWQLRARIGSEVAPERIEELAVGLGQLRPLAEDPLPPAPPTPEAGNKPKSETTETPAADKAKPKVPAKREGTTSGSKKPQSSRER